MSLQIQGFHILQNVGFLYIALICTIYYDYSLATSPPWVGNGLKVELDHNPQPNDYCDHQLYVEFFKKVKAAQGTNVYDGILGTNYANHTKAGSEDFYFDPKLMCIRTDSAGNIDINQWDCQRDRYDTEKTDGTCECGERWNTIDLNDPKSYLGVNSKSHAYEYFGADGLQKYLFKQEDPEGSGNYSCVANRFGHCSLQQESGNVTRCALGHTCRNMTIWNPLHRAPFHNGRTGEWYGICVGETIADGLESPFSGCSRTHINFAMWFVPLLVIFHAIRKLSSMI